MEFPGQGRFADGLAQADSSPLSRDSTTTEGSGSVYPSPAQHTMKSTTKGVNKRGRSNTLDPVTVKKQSRGMRNNAASKANNPPQDSPAPRTMGYMETMGLQKCRIIHFIHTNYTLTGAELPSVANLAKEIHEKLPGLQIRGSLFQGMIPSKPEQIASTLRNFARNDCTTKMSSHDFLRNPTGSLKPGVRYEEYCASINSSSGTADAPELVIADSDDAAQSPSNTPVRSLQNRSAETFRAPETPSHLLNERLRRSDRQAAMADEERGSELRESADSHQHHLNADEDDQPGIVRDSQLRPWSFSAMPDASLRPGDQSRSTSSLQPQPQESLQPIDPNAHRDGTTQPGRAYPALAPTLAFDRFLPDESRFSLDTGLLSDALMKIFSQAKSRMHEDLVARGIAGQPTAFVVNPPLGLQQLYLTITGRDTPKAYRSAIVVGATAENLAFSLFGAFLLKVVFGGAEVETFGDFQAKASQTAATEIDQVLREIRTKWDTVLKKAYLRRLLNGEWAKRTLTPIADRLSDDFAVTLEQHLDVQHGADGKSYGPTMYATADRFFTNIFDALVFKCTISLSPEQTHLLWNVGGEKIDPNSMEGFQNGHERVLLTGFPGFSLSQGSLDPEVVFKAQVLSRRN